MEHDGEAWEFLHDGVEDVECEGRGNEQARLWVARALCGSKFVCAVARADGDGKAVNACARNEVDNFFGLRVVAFFCHNFILNTCEYAEFALYGNVELVSVFNNLLRQSNVLLVGKAATVDHDAAEAHVHTALAEFEAVAVVEVECNFGMVASKFLCVFHSTLCHVAKERLVSIVACTLADLKDDGAAEVAAGLYDSLELLHVVEVECGNGIAAVDGSLEHFASVHEAEFFVVYHTL